MAINFDKFTITSYDQITGFDRTDGSLVLVMDEISDFTLNQTQETTDITGKGGRVISRMKKNKAVEGSGTNGFLSGGALAAMLGAEVKTGDKFIIKYTDAITVTGGTGKTTKKAIGTVGNEIGTIYVRDASNAYVTGGTKLTQVAADPVAGQFTYDAATSTITFVDDDVADGVEVIAFYDAEVEGAKITNDADKYSKVLYLYIDCTCMDACDNVYHAQIIVPRADFSGEFEIAGGSDPATLGFSFTSMPNICTGSSDLWDFICFE